MVSYQNFVCISFLYRRVFHVPPNLIIFDLILLISGISINFLKTSTPHLKTETVSETLCSYNNGRWTKSKNPVILNKMRIFSSLTHSWSWALLEKLPIVQLLKNFPAFYGTRKFITVFTRALHWSLSWARSIQSIPSHPISLRWIFSYIKFNRLVIMTVTERVYCDVWTDFPK
jgi:hypothetical protein